jgi:uncharacterized protein GlcG (DUF336 family)
VKTKKALTLDDARIIVAAAEAEALRNRWNVCIAIVDDGGVSGVKSSEDAQIAQAGISALKV